MTTFNDLRQTTDWSSSCQAIRTDEKLSNLYDSTFFFCPRLRRQMMTSSFADRVLFRSRPFASSWCASKDLRCYRLKRAPKRPSQLLLLLPSLLPGATATSPLLLLNAPQSNRRDADRVLLQLLRQPHQPCRLARATCACIRRQLARKQANKPTNMLWTPHTTFRRCLGSIDGSCAWVASRTTGDAKPSLFSLHSRPLFRYIAQCLSDSPFFCTVSSLASVVEPSIAGCFYDVRSDPLY